MPTPLASAIWWTPSARPSLRSMHADRGAVARQHACRAATRGSGRRYRVDAAASTVDVTSACRADDCSMPQAGRGRADRAGHVELVARPRAAARQRLPALDRADDGDVDHQRPRRSRQVAADDVQPVRARRARRSRRRCASKSASGSAGGSAIESSASRGAAPIAARSLRLTASARWPIASGGDERAIEVDALDERVDGQHLDAVALRLDDRRIVADADQQPGGRRRQVAAGCARSARARSRSRDGRRRLEQRSGPYFA